uniref:HTH CENPB-type domain-containing protein n=1 Tax=Glossina brevipalpis TaxID=37001 RepID=A0A1A9WHC2_9MUSC
MAQHSKPDKYIDVDATQLKPSPNRVRNILTLEERVAAIEAYYCRPMYTKVARMFNCSWEQIKNIIANREAIMKFYEATRKHRPQEDESDINLDVKQKKLRFLGECIYEYIQRVQFHARVDITEELLRTKALEFRDILVLNDFYPSKTWINHFKATYNISLSNRQIALTRVPPSSLDLKDIMTYCTKNKPNNPSLIEIRELQQNLGKEQMGTSIDTTSIEELEEERRARKLSFLEKALAEYVLRAKFHHKSILLNNESLIKVARELNDILKVQQFVPSHNWIQEFRTRHNFDAIQNHNRRPPLSLDLKDILSYCSQEEDIKPDIEEIKIQPIPQETYTPPIKIRKIESINADARIKLTTTTRNVQTATHINPTSCQKSSSDNHSPGHWSEYSNDEDEEEELPRQVRNTKDALRLLKPLEEYAMLKENYRAIGLIAQLEEILKNSQTNPTEKEYET